MEKKRYKVMLVDDDPVELDMGKNILKEQFEVYAIPSGEKLFEVLEHTEANIILLDVIMPGMDGYQTLAKLKANPAWAHIPVIFITALSDESSELQGLDFGAIDYVTKPFSGPLLVKRLQNHLRLAAHEKELRNYNDNLQKTVEAKTRQVTKLQNSLLTAMAEMIEIRDGVTGSHVIRTQKYLEILVEKMIKEHVYHDEIAAWNLEFLYSSAQLHDVGKIAVSDAILNKSGKLTSEEFDKMKSHTTVGADTLAKIEKLAGEHDFLQHAKVIAGTHHERWDGSGYPKRLSGSAIPLQGRLMALADVYDALISWRPYKEAFSHETAEKIICKKSGSHFDPALVDIFKKVTPLFAEVSKMYR